MDAIEESEQCALLASVDLVCSCKCVLSNMVESDSSSSDRNYLSSSSKQVQLNAFLQLKLKNTMTSSDGISEQPLEDEICMTHRLKQDVLCITCRQKICASCAIFAGHRTHELIQIESAIQMIEERAEMMAQMYSRIEQVRKDVLNEQLFQQTITNAMNVHLTELLQEADSIFNELEGKLHKRKSRVERDIREKVKAMETMSLNYVKTKLSSISRQSDLWCMSMKTKIDYFTRQTEVGDMPIDLLGECGTAQIRDRGTVVLEELFQAHEALQLKLNEMMDRSIYLEYRGGIDKQLEEVVDVVVRDKKSYRVDQKSQEHKQMQENLLLQEHSLLKDINNPLQELDDQQLRNQQQNEQSLRLRTNQQNDFQQYDQQSRTSVNLQQQYDQQTRMQQQYDQQSRTYVYDKNPNQQQSQLSTILNEHQQKQLRSMQTSPCFEGRASQASPFDRKATTPLVEQRNSQRPRQSSKSPSTRRMISPSPMSKQVPKSKLAKLADKYKNVVAMLRDDALESADFSGAELGDDALIEIIPIILASSNLRVLKLVKNKISDNGASHFIKHIIAEQNRDQYALPTNILASVNLSNNIITDKIVDLILLVCIILYGIYDEAQRIWRLCTSRV